MSARLGFFHSTTVVARRCSMQRRGVRILGMVLLLALGFGLATVKGGAPRVHAANFNVNTNADGVDANPGDGICLTAQGACTLRAAIMQANASPGLDTITFPA